MAGSVSSPRSRNLRSRGDGNAWLKALLPFVVAVLGAAIVYWRTPAAARDVIWAEDGRNFMVGHLTNGFGGILEPYQGYLHVIPRLLAGLVVELVPPEQVAHGFTIAAALVIGAISGAIAWLSASTIERLPLRVLAGLVPALVPTGPLEAAGNLANLHWYLVLLGFWLFMAVPRNWLVSLLTAVLALAMALSEPMLLLALPILLRNIRDRRSWPVAAAAVAGVAVQLTVSFLFPRELFTGGAKLDISDVVIGYMFEPFVGSFWWDTARVARRIQLLGHWWLVVAFALVALVLILALIAGRNAHRWQIAAHILGSASVWAGSLLLTPAESFQFAFDVNVFVDNFRVWRYVAAASMLALVGLVVAADALLVRARLRWMGVAVASVVGLSLLINAAGVDPDRVTRAGAANWPAEIERASEVCRDESVAEVQVKTFPSHWEVVVPCDWVRSSTATSPAAP